MVLLRDKIYFWVAPGNERLENFEQIQSKLYLAWKIK